MNIIKHPAFVFIIIVAAIIYAAKLMNVTLPKWTSFYLNDLLCMPIVLSLSLAAIRYLKKDDLLYIPPLAIILITAYYSFHFEWLLPQFNSRYTSDWIDVLLYVSGAGVFYAFQKRLF